MAINLVSIVMQFLTPDMIGRIASMLGLDRNTAQSAVGAAVPALMAGLANTAAQPGGGQRLAEAATQQSGALDSFSRVLGGADQTSFIERGSQMLTSLFGGREQGALTAALARFTGLDQSSVGSLLGMLAPVVMGTVAQQTAGRGLDASRITDLLVGQKDNIVAALPPGLGNLLGGTGLLDSLGTTARSTASAANDTARAAASSGSRMAGDASRRVAGGAAPSANWAYWLIPIAAVAAFLVYFASRPGEEPTGEGTPAAQSVTPAGANLGKQVSDTLSSARTTLDGVTDAVTARAALPRLQEITAEIDKVSAPIAQLSQEQRNSIAGIVHPVMGPLNQSFDKVLATPGASEVLKPTIDGLKAKLAGSFQSAPGR